MKQIGSFYLYDNQLSSDYLILNNRTKRYDFKINENDDIVLFETDEFKESLPYEISGDSYGALHDIYNLDKNTPDFKTKSLEIMTKACKKANLLLIKLDIPLEFRKIGDTHLLNYNAYEIWYDERNGDLGNYELAHSWNLGASSTSIYRLYDF